MERYECLEKKLLDIETQIKELEFKARLIKMALIDEVFSTSLPDTAYPPIRRFR